MIADGKFSFTLKRQGDKARGDKANVNRKSFYHLVAAGKSLFPLKRQGDKARGDKVRGDKVRGDKENF